MSLLDERMNSTRSLLPILESTLRAFTNSSSTFRVVRTVNPASGSVHDVKTLYILDSSFNPPSIAHLSLATSALRSSTPDLSPRRLLLLFSTHNADKSPNPADFAQRLSLIVLFAEDLSSILSQSKDSREIGSSDRIEATSIIPIDIGLTKAPYYTDKSTAITTSNPPIYPSNPTHVHLMGYDTATRLVSAKYYPNHTPPLSALAPYFDVGHKLRITQRPANSEDSSSSQFGSTEEQRAFLIGLAAGEKEDLGFKKQWAEQIEMVEGDEGLGVSSTRVREAVKKGDWNAVAGLCTPGVTAGIKEMRLYQVNS